jgi:hypothetical protein
MVLDSQTTNSKAIMGAVFIQYVVYGLVYIIEGMRYESLHSTGNSPSPAK